MQERDSRRLINSKNSRISNTQRDTVQPSQQPAPRPTHSRRAGTLAKCICSSSLLQGRNRCTITQCRTCHAQPHHRRVLKCLVRLTCYSIHLHCPLSDDDLSYAQHNLLGCLHLISLENRVIDFGGPTVLGSLGAGLPGPCLERLDHVDVAAR